MGYGPNAGQTLLPVTGAIDNVNALVDGVVVDGVDLDGSVSCSVATILTTINMFVQMLRYMSSNISTATGTYIVCLLFIYWFVVGIFYKLLFVMALFVDPMLLRHG